MLSLFVIPYVGNARQGLVNAGQRKACLNYSHELCLSVPLRLRRPAASGTTVTGMRNDGGEWALRQNDSRALAGINWITISAAQVRVGIVCWCP